MQECDQLWSGALGALRETLDADTFERYVAHLSPLGFDPASSTIRLGVLNDFTAFWLESNYKPIIMDALSGHWQSPVSVVFEPGHAPVAPPPPVAEAVRDEERAAATGKKRSRTMAQPFRYRPDFTFDTFVVGNSSRICAAAAHAVAKNPGKAYNPLCVYGGVGLGKTHLLQAIANDVFQRRKRAKIEYLSSEEFVNLYVEALRNKTLPSFRRHFRSLDLLLIDDVQFFEGKVSSCEEFFHTFNTLHNAHKQIVLASDRTPSEIGLEQRMVSRFEWGLSAEIMSPDLETRMAILRKKQEKQNVHLPDDVLSLIAKHVRSNIRNLESALTKLVMNVSAFGYEMTCERAMELLQDKFDQEASQLLTIEQIQKRVAEQFDIRLADMTSKRRPRSIAEPRMLAMYLSRQLTGHSYPAIGEAFNRNHATVMHAEAAVTKRIDQDPEFASVVSTLTRQLRT